MSAEPSSHPRAGVVIIGRNEGQRLRRCLVSITGRDRIVVYVDSASSDGSTEMARSMGAVVVDLDMSLPFSAARARNAGVERMISIQPNIELVQFIDGDCEMIDGWMDRAERAFADSRELSAVCGRLRERYPGHSIYNRLADLEWEMPAGQVNSCGGIAMMRLSEFRAAGGFDPTVVAGEEPELCQRLRRRGGIILRLSDEMALHDSAMTRFAQWWTRAVRNGYGASDVAKRFASGRDGLFVRQIRSARIWAIAWPSAVLLGGCIAAAAGGVKWGLLIAALVACVAPAQIIRLAIKSRRRVGSFRTALAFGAFTLIGKWANLAGQYRYCRDRSAGRRRLIEYKAIAPTSEARPTPS